MHFGHIEKIEPRVVIIGVGNTAMDCCRTAKRVGATDVKVVARRGRKHFKASPWELEDAEEEQVEIIENHAPKRMVIENGRLTGMEFEVLEWTEDANGKQISTVTGTTIIRVTRSFSPSARQRLPLDRTRHRRGIRWPRHAEGRQDHASRARTRRCSSAVMRHGVGEHHLGRGARPSGGHLHRPAVPGQDVHDRPPYGMTLVSAKMGMHSWAYDNDYETAKRAKMKHEELVKRFSGISIER